MCLRPPAHETRQGFVWHSTVNSSLLSPGVDRFQADQHAVLASRVLLQCAEGCERALEEYVARVGMPTKHEVFRELLPTIAIVRTAADLHDDKSSRRELALHLADDACKRAAARCRRYGLDESLLRCAAACDRAVVEVELLLTSSSHT
jgi:hypothetical protein